MKRPVGGSAASNGARGDFWTKDPTPDAQPVSPASPPAHTWRLGTRPPATGNSRADRPDRLRLGDVLVDSGLVSMQQMEEAMAHRPGSDRELGRLLLRSGAIDERSLTTSLGALHGIRVVDLRFETPDPGARSRLPEATAREMCAIPLSDAPSGLEVAMADPPESETVARLSKAAGTRVQVVLAAESDIRRAIDASYRTTDTIDQQIKAFQAAAAAKSRSQTRADPRAEEASDRALEPDAPVVEVVNAIVTQALRDRASDIHIEPQGDRVRVRYRVDGTLHDVLSLPAAMGPTLVSRIKIVAGMNIVERRRAQDGRFDTVIDGRKLDVRVATSSTIRGETAVLRLLDTKRSLYRMDQLGMPTETHTQFSRLVRSPFGMVVAAGPTGSGKTTTLYAALGEINTPERNIMTIEDPVEYVVPSVNQAQINEAADITFAGGLKAILRQDPDVILVGEMRDVETARIAVQSALTGHLVLSTVHATDAVSALLRFLDMGIESFLIASSVLAVVAQRLVRRICTACTTPYEPTAEELAFYHDAGGRTKTRFWHGEGCNFCAQTGYQDRIGVYEMLVLDDALRKFIVSGAEAAELRARAINGGMRTLKDEGLRLVGEDVTTIAEIVRTIYVA